MKSLNKYAKQWWSASPPPQPQWDPELTWCRRMLVFLGAPSIILLSFVVSFWRCYWVNRSFVARRMLWFYFYDCWYFGLGGGKNEGSSWENGEFDLHSLLTYSYAFLTVSRYIFITGDEPSRLSWNLLFHSIYYGTWSPENKKSLANTSLEESGGVLSIGAIVSVASKSL